MRACRPTGVKEDDIISMSISKHLGERVKLSYDSRTYPHQRLIHHIAIKILRRIPNFSDEIALSSIDEEDHPMQALMNSDWYPNKKEGSKR